MHPSSRTARGIPVAPAQPCLSCMFTYPTLLGSRARSLKKSGQSLRPQGSPVRKAIYVAGLVLLGGALIIQSVWGADILVPDNRGHSAPTELTQ
jgi:hypothetical protein